MHLNLHSIELGTSACRARTPFRFGVASVERATSLVARVELELADGRRGVGHAADLCMPRWFRKDVERAPQADVEALLEAARAARSSWLTHAGAAGSLFEHWWAVYSERVDALPFEHPERLERGFGVALIERAAIDALCHAAQLSFFEALRGEQLGFEPGRVHPELDGWSLAASLPSEPSAEVELRHTIGLGDALRSSELAGSERIGDGEPESLEEYVRAHALSCFKLKLGGDVEHDRARMIALAELLDGSCDAQPRLSLDANEQYLELERLLEVLEGVEATPAGRRLLGGLLWIEQPLPRERCFDARALGGLEELSQRAPLLLDEGDTGLHAFQRARELGWQGVSVKNCKGVFRALLNRGMCARLDGFQSAEDLTNLPAIALQQDLATVAALGMPHVERNGHHYFRGLDHLPPAEARAALASCPALYEASADGVRLRVRAGQLVLSDLQGVGYGGARCASFDERERIESPER